LLAYYTTNLTGLLGFSSSGTPVLTFAKH